MLKLNKKAYSAQNLCSFSCFCLVVKCFWFAHCCLQYKNEGWGKIRIQKLLRNNCDIQLINHNYFHPQLDGLVGVERKNSNLHLLPLFFENESIKNSQKSFKVVLFVVKALKTDLHKQQANYGILCWASLIFRAPASKQRYYFDKAHGGISKTSHNFPNTSVGLKR